MKTRIIVIFLLSVFFTFNVFAADYGKISITERQPFGAVVSSGVSTHHGYAEYRFLVKNRDTVPHKVKISMEPQMHYGSVASLVFSTDAVEVAAGSSATLRVLQPPIRFSYVNFLQAYVIIDGWTQSPDMSLACDHMIASRHTHGVLPVEATVCFSQQVPTTIRDFFARRSVLPPDDGADKTSPPPASVPSTMRPPFPCMHSNVPVEDWSDLWVSYSRFDCLVLTAVEWDGLLTRKPAVLSAIKRYVESGGVLVIVGEKWECPAEWEYVVKNPAIPIESEAKKQHGFERTIVYGKLFAIGSTGTEVAANAPHFYKIIQQIDLVASTEKQRMGLAQSETSRNFRNNANSSTISQMHEFLPVVTKYGVNIRLILVLIIVFAVLIGPVNVFVLRRINRRIWLIWTVPATSLIASFLVLLVSFLSEGILRQSSSLTCTVLDQRRGSASTFGFIGYYV
jgi:hypothetical protein